ncbi:MAG: hypothetical protein LUG16_03405 [Candidatus Gastranaerophilales bacterium]|nr:hypothetical protein [Candidatus Gastranaerophilales bacterium]
MNNNKIPIISISMTKPAIRIYKETLHQIGNPTHILLLVNPKDYSLAIFPSCKSDVKAHNVEKYMKSNYKSVVLYSTPLIRSLKTLCPEWKNDGTYKFYGEVFPEERVAKFIINKGIEIIKQEK